ncbi:MAG: hypothetical protein IPN91_15850 [Holophagaceae bacterium]|uniref:Uncharacterized protein n=1 Tax=Candidatus Geothrix odensensis TaxID=2954440 RepID=A0A936K6S1_9BACT|nr:hypothetical protein [Candidatus Geothrix odensensis]
MNADESAPAATRPPVRLNLGGPILKDKLHYFINVEMARKREDSIPVFGDGTAESNSFFAPARSLWALCC